jgi:IS6 family transposase
MLTTAPSSVGFHATLPTSKNALVPSSSLPTTPGRATRPTCAAHRCAIKGHGDWYYLYRAIDSAGNTLDFMRSPTRDARAVKCFFRKLLDDKHTVKPRVITVDKNVAYPAAFKALQEEGELAAECRLRQVKYLNNLVEQDHRFIQRRMKPGLGFNWSRTAWATVQGYEAMNQLRKGQVEGTSKGDISSQVRFINPAFGLAA